MNSFGRRGVFPRLLCVFFLLLFQGFAFSNPLFLHKESYLSNSLTVAVKGMLQYPLNYNK